MKNATCFLLDTKGNIHKRKSKYFKFTREEISIMVGGDIEAKKLECKSIHLGEEVLKFPVYFVNKRARAIPLLPNEPVMELLKKSGVVELPLGNVVFINQIKIEKDAFK